MNNWFICWFSYIPLNAELNPICHLLALLEGATIVVVSRLRVKVVRLTPHLLYVLATHGEIFRCSPNNKPVRIQTQYGRFGAQKSFLAVPGIDPSSFDLPGNSLITIANEKFQLPATSQIDIITEESRLRGM